MRLLKDGPEFPRFEAFNVANGSRRFQEDYRSPDVVVVLGPVSDQIDAITGRAYRVVKRIRFIRVLIPENRS